MAVIEQILEWASGQPEWQQKAVSLLLTKDALDDAEIAELVCLCKEEGDAPNSEHSELSPEVARREAKGSVTLQMVSDVSNVNALAQGANISFGEGLNIVYGDNASGKSGFCRILKNMCRARHAEELLPNVHIASEEIPGATVHYSVDDVQQDCIAWQKGDGQVLPSVSVFDSKCATVYVENENDVAYRPFGLDIFDRLASVCERMERVIQLEMNTAEENLDDFSEIAAPTTAVGALLGSLSASTKTADVASLATLTETEMARIVTLQKEILRMNEQDPEKKKRALVALKGRISTLSTHLGQLEASFSEEKLTALKTLQKDAKDTKEAAKIASEQAFDDVLPGFGGDAWKKLWEAARTYSAVAYPDEDFPVTREGAVCVTCQQKILEDAAPRLNSFEDFVKQEAQKAADTATRVYSAARTEWLTMKICPTDWENISQELEPETKSSVEMYLSSIWQRRASVAIALRTNDWSTIPALPTSQHPLLQPVIAEIQKEIEALKPSDPAQLARTQKELEELTARQELKKVLSKVYRHIVRLGQLQNLQTTKRKLNTGTITRQSTKLSKAAITEPLCKQFQNELQSIGLPLAAEFTHSKSERGVPYHRIVLQGHDGTPLRLEQIASESEHRSLAISGFFTELATAENKSAIVFDDPVSSFDHVRREVIAKRLVKEAEGRQVVVFTHDIVFVMALKEWADRGGMEPTYRHIRGETQGFGVCYDGLPWSAKNVGERIGELRAKCHTAKTVLEKQGREVYEALGQNIYGLLREAWERAVEEVLLHGTIERFRKGVETKRLRKVEIQAGDYDSVEEGMAKCSTWMPGHDIAPAVGARFPEPDEVLSDINALDAWVASVRQRREQKKSTSQQPATQSV